MSAPTRGPWLDSSVQATETAKRVAVESASLAFIAASNRLPTLFDLEAEAYQLLAAMEGTENPDDFSAAEHQLALVDEMLMHKTESYVSVIRSLESMADAREAEEHRLRDRKLTARAHADWLRARLLTHMKVTERERIETARFTLSVRQNPPSVTVLDASAVPSEFQRTKIEVTVDKRGILEVFKRDGELIPGTEIVRTERLELR